MICQRYDTKNDTNIPMHECFLNWNKCSTAMEADGVLEDFTSILIHDFKYNRIIGKKKYQIINYYYAKNIMYNIY